MRACKLATGTKSLWMMLRARNSFSLNFQTSRPRHSLTPTRGRCLPQKDSTTSSFFSKCHHHNFSCNKHNKQRSTRFSHHCHRHHATTLPTHCAMIIHRNAIINYTGVLPSYCKHFSMEKTEGCELTAPFLPSSTRTVVIAQRGDVTHLYHFFPQADFTR